MTIKKFNEMYIGKRARVIGGVDCVGLEGVIIRGYAPEHLISIYFEPNGGVHIGSVDYVEVID